MREVWKTIRLLAYVAALPLAITAAVSAHQRMLDSQPIGTLTAAPVTTKPPALAGTFRGHTLAIDEMGIVRGRLTVFTGSELNGLGKARVMLVRNGAIAHLSKTTADGSFDLHGVEPGDYSFIATNGKQFATFGARIVAYDSANEAADVIEVATVNADSPAVIKILETQLPIADLIELTSNDAPVNVPLGANLVQIKDGQMVGRLYSLEGLPMDQVKISLIGGDEVRELNPEADGSFMVDNVAPGPYDFLAIGQAGFAVLRFEAIDANDPALELESPMIYTSTASTATPASPMAAAALEVALTLPQDETIVSEQMTFTQDDSAPSVMESQPVGTDVGYSVAAGCECAGCGNWGGFGGACGCGGFGGGGLAGLGRLAIIGWILTELFDEIDFSRPPPPSPDT